ncbi:Outer membrane protein assembly factor BamA [Myxococcus stipitatus]
MNRLALLFSIVSLVASAQPAPETTAPTPAPAAPAEPTPPAPSAQQPRPEDSTPQARDEDEEGDEHDEDDDSASHEEEAWPLSMLPNRGEKSSKKHQNLDACEEDLRNEEVDESAVLTPLQLNLSGRTITPERVELHGLQRLTQAQVYTFIGTPLDDPQTPQKPRKLQTMLRRLALTGLFARVEPRLRVPEQGPVVLEVHLEENPVVTSVELKGLRDIQDDEILDELFRLPHRITDEDEDGEEDFVATVRMNGARGVLTVSTPCPPQRPPKEWLARMDKGVFVPGLIQGGVEPAMQRALNGLRNSGYLLARLSGSLSPSGQLVLTVDEGQLESVEVVGVDGSVATRVREAMDLKAGDVFLRSDARRAMERLESRLPFLEAASVSADPDDIARGRDARIVQERAADGTRHFTTQEPKRKERRRHEKYEFELSWRELFAEWNNEKESQGITLDGRRLVVHVRPRSPEFSGEILPVHTQVTGLAPGLAGSFRIWDVKDRVHTTLDAAAFVPLRLKGQHVADDPDATKRQRRINLLGGAKVEIPAVGLVELGAQAHDFTDTLDRWRMSDIDSSLYSVLINRPDRDYFRRKGVAAFATFRFAEDWLAGVEYRSDRYSTMYSLTPPLTLFRRDSPPFPNAPVDEGRFQSVVARLEYTSTTPRNMKVGSLFRTPETPLADPDVDWNDGPFLHGFATLEVGEGPAVTGPDERFWKLVSDVSLVVPTGWNTGLRVRLRAAGGDHLPEQKREALGGWSALRGFGFKEFGGDASVLATAEYRWHVFGVFADLGTVRAEKEWMDARLGVGGSFHFSDEVRVDVAWRTDEKATSTPEARLFFVRTF